MAIRPVYSHDRTVITIMVLLVGGALLWRYGEGGATMAAVSSIWTLVLTFWFRSSASPEL